MSKLRGMVPPDPLTNVSAERYAVVYVPKRNRKRFAANCVTVVESVDEALAMENREAHRYAAIVIGPSKSSEGQFIYYLGEWL
ncbi:MAG: hypothetical protein ACWA44_04980 [Thiotrichales bacterium]